MREEFATSAASLVLNRQADWARQSGKTVVNGCFESYQSNLCQTLSAETLKDITKGAGDELGLAKRTSRRAKMLSLRSSTALALNFFEPMRFGELSVLGEALGLDFKPLRLAFEVKRPHGLYGGTPPHLDVMLFGAPGVEQGVESKFAEPYDSNPTAKKILKGAYFPEGEGRWARLGLVRCQAYADSLRDDVEFKRLDAAQLLKHILGLAHSVGAGGRVRLTYLWYEVPSPEADVHRTEVEEFTRRVGDDVLFSSMTYQELFHRIELSLVPGHRRYLRERYF